MTQVTRTNPASTSAVPIFPIELVNSQTQRIYSVTSKLLGKGGFGSVREGVDCLTGSPVGIKTQKDSAVSKSEALMSKIIRAPHLVSCRAAFEGSLQSDSASESHIVMDLIKEVNIIDAFYISNQVRLTPRQIITITRQSLEFLDALGHQEIVYFDVKPQNMIFRPKCGSLTFIDLGGARQLKDIPTVGIITTRMYCAPEYFLRGKLTPAFDLWSLGVTLYSLCTGFRFVNTPNEMPKEQQGNYFLQSIAQRIGKPSAEFLKGCKKTEHYFNESGEFRNPVSLPPIKCWKEIVRNMCQINLWPNESISPFIELLGQLLRYENRTAAEELLKSPLFDKEIVTHLEYDRRQKCKIYIHRSLEIPFSQTLKPADLGVVDLTIDLTESVDPCLHIPRDPKANYILILEKEDVYLAYRISLKDGGMLDIKPYQVELAQLTSKAKRNLFQTLDEAENPPVKKARKENIPPQIVHLDFRPASSTRSRKPMAQKKR